MGAGHYELLSRDFALHLLSEESTEFREGISICSIKMAKGLEFDEVVVLDVEKDQYQSKDDQNLLYVAITRAMHKLTLLYRAEVSPFLSGLR